MSVQDHQDVHTSPWDGFAATLLHDIGKVGEVAEVGRRWRRDGRSVRHDAQLQAMLTDSYTRLKISGQPEIPNLWYELIAGSEWRIGGTIHLAHKLADAVSKQIQGECYSRLENPEWLCNHPEEQKKLHRDTLPTVFLPYFGNEKEWAGTKPNDKVSSHADETWANICRDISNGLTLPRILAIQDRLADFPHSRYVPHLSLRLHDLFAASIFYFAYLRLKELADPRQLGTFVFHTVEITPNLLDVFYRLRNVLACSSAAGHLYRETVKRLFLSWEGDLPGVSEEGKPFVFYHSNGFVLLYPDFRVVQAALKAALNDAHALRGVDIRTYQFSIETKWHDDHWELSNASVKSSFESLPSPSLHDFQPDNGQRCGACQRIVAASELVEDDKENWVCAQCRNLRQASSGVDIDLVSQAGKGSNRVAYIFTTLPPNLRNHAAEVAEKLICQFWSDYKLPATCQLPATEGRIYEYLQALLAISQFDAVLKEKVQAICCEQGQYAAAVLFFNPSSKAVVVHEDHFWDLLEFIHHQKQQLHLECSVRAVICSPKTPFWSLIELATRHQAGDILWDVSREAIHMFSDTEILSIRNLASSAQKYRIWRNQLNSLSSIALQTTLEELILELDNRTDRLKELHDPLTKAIRDLRYPGNDLKDREKRAVFFKYIAGLTR